MEYRSLKTLLPVLLTVFSIAACSPAVTDKDDVDSVVTYSPFGPYQALPEWSQWCTASPNPTACQDELAKLVDNPGPDSRKWVRYHGWHLWAGILAPVSNSGFDAKTYTSKIFGTSGCWSEDNQGQQACSGAYPLWMTWPNTGKPYALEIETEHKVEKPVHLLKISRNFTPAETPVLADSAESTPVISDSADPRTTFTVNTLPADQVPVYTLPAQAIAPFCGGTDVKTLQAEINDAQWELLESQCPGVVCAAAGGVCDGMAFVNEGNVMIATESLTEQAWQNVQENNLAQASTLAEFYLGNENNQQQNAVSGALSSAFISTKHMFWPVKGCKPGIVPGQKGCRIRYGALPVWLPEQFKNADVNYGTDDRYRGYETWQKLVAIDSCNSANGCAPGSQAELALSYVEHAQPIIRTNPDVYSVDDFVHIQVSEEALYKGFSAADRALLNQAVIWAYGDDAVGFEPGDFLVTVAMHINTKEISSWALQSVWWSPMDDNSTTCPVDNVRNCYGQSDVYSANPQYSLMSAAVNEQLSMKNGNSQWYQHYVMSDSYGIPYEINGQKATAQAYFDGTPPNWAVQRPDGQAIDQLPVAMNVYIEPVIHPLGSNCQNCHQRAAVSNKLGSNAPGNYATGKGIANYQTSQCPSLLADYGDPATNPCIVNPWVAREGGWTDPSATNNCSEPEDSSIQCRGKDAYPLVNTDFAWFIADGHVQSLKKVGAK